VEPGSVNDLPAARAHVLPALYASAAKSLPTLADLGYQGAGIGVITPVKQPSDGPPLARHPQECQVCDAMPENKRNAESRGTLDG
jgi:hypothetical protein